MSAGYGKIDVSLLDSTRLFQGKPRQDGHVPMYLDFAIVELRVPDKFGNTHMVVESVSRADREAGVRGRILGSFKQFGGQPSQPTRPANPWAPQQPQRPPPRPPPQRPIAPPPEAQEDIPF
jgi:hypothetical protein